FHRATTPVRGGDGRDVPAKRVDPRDEKGEVEAAFDAKMRPAGRAVGECDTGGAYAVEGGANVRRDDEPRTAWRVIEGEGASGNTPCERARAHTMRRGGNFSRCFSHSLTRPSLGDDERRVDGGVEGGGRIRIILQL